jgi:HSP20 family protein
MMLLERMCPTLPFGDLRREIDRLFEGVAVPFNGGFLHAPAVFPAVNVWEDGDCLYAEAELPGVDPKEIEIEVVGNVLTLRGEKKHEREEEGKGFHYVERRYGGFIRNIELPTSVDSEKVSAACKNGVLTVTLPKHPESKPKRIAVRNA